MFQFCVSDVGTLSTLITPGTTSSTTEPAAGTSERNGEAESAPVDKPGRVMVTWVMVVSESSFTLQTQPLKTFYKQVAVVKAVSRLT